jgi:hypothetical protein
LHSLASGPVHSVHDVSHGEQTVSAVGVHAPDSYVFTGQFEQTLHSPAFRKRPVAHAVHFAGPAPLHVVHVASQAAHVGAVVARHVAAS